MEEKESSLNSPLRKRRYSRVTKFGYIIILILTSLYLISATMIFVLTLLSSRLGISEQLIERVAEFIRIDVAGAIGTIASLVIARYGAREVSANIKGIKYDSETDKDEEKKCEEA